MLNRFERWNKFMAFAVVLCFCATSFCGCTTLRRKFVRKSTSKEITVDFIPVLEPVEYKRVEASSFDSYKSHYAMVKAYFGDAYAAMGNADSSEKRERYLLGQIVAHLRGMAGLLRDTRKADAEAAAVNIEVAMKELDKPAGLRRYDLISGAVRKIEDDIRRKLKPDMVKEFILLQ